VGSIIANLYDEVFAGQTLQHCHHCCVRKIALCGEGLVDLSHSLGRGGVPQMVHHRSFQIA
jgi:hypothetical protein